MAHKFIVPIVEETMFLYEIDARSGQEAAFIARGQHDVVSEAYRAHDVIPPNVQIHPTLLKVGKVNTAAKDELGDSSTD